MIDISATVNIPDRKTAKGLLKVVQQVYDDNRNLIRVAECYVKDVEMAQVVTDGLLQAAWDNPELLSAMSENHSELYVFNGKEWEAWRDEAGRFLFDLVLQKQAQETRFY